MIALDTNVLVRLLVEDEEEDAVRQRRRVAALLRATSAAGDRLFVPSVVLCEAVWVMRTSYRVSRAALAAAVAGLLGTKHLAFDAPDRVSRALNAFAAGKGDFADYLIREHARAAGCDAVATFDRALLREDGFRAP